jgi:peptide/nickel transport system ATP-binding protein
VIPSRQSKKNGSFKFKHYPHDGFIEVNNEFVYLQLMDKPLLETRGLAVQYHAAGNTIRIIEDINFSIRRGEIFALVGESGCGKSTLAYSLTNLFARSSGLTATGEVWFGENDLLQLEEKPLRKIRQRKIRYVFQEPLQSFNPIYRIKSQYLFSLAGTGRETYARKSLISDLHSVGIENPDDVLHSFPHQLSGGTLQRILIAMALAAEPDLIIADEPTSSVDAILQYQLLDLIDRVKKNGRSSILLITHNLKVAKRYADVVAVMYAGRIVETSPAEKFFNEPLHPYSKTLFMENGFENFKKENVFDFYSAKISSGCKYSTLCSRVRDECRITEPDLQRINSEREVRCLFWK